MNNINLQVQKVYNEQLVVSDTAVTLATDPTASRIAITSTGIVLSADGVTPVTPVSGDDVLIEGTIDGTHYFQLGADGAPLNHQLDVEGVAGTPSVVVGAISGLRLTPSQIQATEQVTFNVTSTIGQ